MLIFRRIDPRERSLERIAEVWRSQGWNAVLQKADQHSLWVPVTDSEQRWRGWLQVNDWLAHVAPELAGLAISAGVDMLIASWLSTIEQPINFPMPELAYSRLVFGMPVIGNKIPQYSLLRVEGTEGALWLESVNSINQGNICTLNLLSCPLRFVIGDSRIPLSLLSKICCGDILIITQLKYEVRCYEKTLCSYQQIENGVVIMDYQNTNDEPLEQNKEALLVTSDINQLPVILEFVLHRHKLTLRELQNLCQGQLFSLPTDAELRVEIRTNGMLLGYGELVQMNEQLGVEVHEWLAGNKNDE